MAMDFYPFGNQSAGFEFAAARTETLCGMPAEQLFLEPGDAVQADLEGLPVVLRGILKQKPAEEGLYGRHEDEAAHDEGGEAGYLARSEVCCEYGQKKGES